MKLAPHLCRVLSGTRCIARGIQDQMIKVTKPTGNYWSTWRVRYHPRNINFKYYLGTLLQKKLPSKYFSKMSRLKQKIPVFLNNFKLTYLFSCTSPGSDKTTLIMRLFVLNADWYLTLITSKKQIHIDAQPSESFFPFFSETRKHSVIRIK